MYSCKKKPRVFVCLCCVRVCFGDQVCQFARAGSSVDASLGTLCECCVCVRVFVCVCVCVCDPSGCM